MAWTKVFNILQYTSIYFRTVLSLNKATSSKKIQTCSCCKYRGFSDFQPQNLTLKMWQKFGSFWIRQLNKSGWCNYLFILFPTQLKSSIQLDAAWEVSCTIALWVCASRFPTTVPTFHAFTIQLHDPSPVWRPHLSNLNDAWGQGAEGRPLCYLPEHVTAQKALYRKEPINSTFSQGNFFTESGHIMCGTMHGLDSQRWRTK